LWRMGSTRVYVVGGSSNRGMWLPTMPILCPMDHNTSARWRRAWVAEIHSPTARVAYGMVSTIVSTSQRGR